MAERSLRVPENVPGKYYVDQECIDCSLCSEIAPEHFRVEIDQGYDYVHHQPITEAEEHLCQEAMESCPVEAIGDDGE